MTLEAVFASLHLLAVLAVVVFLTSVTALCRTELMSAAVVRRLARMDTIYWCAVLVLLVTGVVRVVWGIKGTEWYVSQPLSHLKALLFVVMVVLSVWPSMQIRKWLQALNASGELPVSGTVIKTRKWLMAAAHMIPIIAVVAVFWVRGM